MDVPFPLSRQHLWLAICFADQADQMPYIELLPGYWGELCASSERASAWADRFIPTIRLIWSDKDSFAYFNGCDACLSCLLYAGRYQELLDLIEMAPHMWHYHQWGVKALVGMGQHAEALRYAEASRDINTSPSAIAAACESILIDSGMADEAYRRYAIQANKRNTYLASFRAIVKKYPHKEQKDVLADLVASTPDQEGKWFATAKSIGLFDEAIDLANLSPCNPQTLVRAARDMRESNPAFAMKAGITALRWMLAGCGYDLTGTDVLAALHFMMEAAAGTEQQDDALSALDELMERKGSDEWVVNILKRTSYFSDHGI